MKFKYVDKNYKKSEDELSFSPSGLCNDCPLQYFFTKELEKEIAKELQEIFSVGHDHHDREVILNDGAKCIILAEEPMKIKHKKFGYIISAKPDHIKYDFDGRYIEDYKTCNNKALKKFFDDLEDGIDVKYVIQLSIYAFVYFINTGIVIARGVITKIDKVNPRNRGSRELELMTIDETEKFITTHPTVLYLTGQENFEYLREKAERKIHSLDCDYCGYRVEHEAMMVGGVK